MYVDSTPAEVRGQWPQLYLLWRQQNGLWHGMTDTCSWGTAVSYAISGATVGPHGPMAPQLHGPTAQRRDDAAPRYVGASRKQWRHSKASQPHSPTAPLPHGPTAPRSKESTIPWLLGPTAPRSHDEAQGAAEVRRSVMQAVGPGWGLMFRLIFQ